jgi:NAD(P)-dependent dehydrogenase (short-subunit alcohol dehydrogenase family)
MKPSDAFAGGTVVVTGAGSGIGKSLAIHCAKLGMRVVVAELSDDRGKAVEEQINSSGGQALFVQTDVTDPASMRALAATTFEAFGDVTLLFNNAGIIVLGDVWEVSDEDWQRGVNVNFMGVVNGVKAFGPNMIANTKSTYICNITSTAAVSSVPHESVYIATKHAVLSLSESLYMEMKAKGSNVNVSASLPGIISTEIFADSTRTNERDEAHGDGVKQFMADAGMPADLAAEKILESVANGDFWVFTHPKETTFCADDRAEFLRQRSKPRQTPNPFIEPN